MKEATKFHMAKEIKHGRIAVIEDDRGVSALTTHHLTTAGFEVQAYFDGESARDALEKTRVDAICLDLGLPDISGMDLFALLRRNDPTVPILVLTADNQVTTAVQAMRAGAYDYLTKPIDSARLITSIRGAVGIHEANRVNIRPPLLHESETFEGLVGESWRMKAMYLQIQRAAQSTISVLLHGESGTGKELVARAMHRVSERSSGSFVAINCAAIPENLQEAELFGYERGAFTGAHQRTPGRFEQANGGTLFLDEVAELKLDLQAKLLRVLQEHTFRRVGGQHELHSDFRVVAASHKELSAEVRAGRFREDLYFRLAVFEISVPPLRDRMLDVPALVSFFCSMYASRDGSVATVSKAAMDMLESYSWPGNVRELQNAIHRGVILATNGVIDVPDLPPRLTAHPLTNNQPTSRHRMPKGSTQPPPLPEVDFRTIYDANGVLDLAEMEKNAILSALAKTSGNMKLSAKALGIGRTTLYRKLKKYNLPFKRTF
jgi:DNA-binding NtrC family response regulator